MSSYVYIRSEEDLWTVGFYMPDGEWWPESDHDHPEKAAKRTAWLNGGDPVLGEELNSDDGTYKP